jgi:predicted Zn finger-like uncharacterized protein
MEVRCERCKTEYEFDDSRVSEAGVAVQCTTCGHTFKVKKKAVLVTVPLQPGEVPAAPGNAPDSTPTSAGAPPQPQREWKVRLTNGSQFTFRELTTLQKWIVEGKVSRDAEISLAGTEHWKRLGNIGALAPFFKVVDDAFRGARQQPLPPALSPDHSAAPPAVGAPPLAQQTVPELSFPLPQPSIAPSEAPGLVPIHAPPGPELPSVIVEGFHDYQPDDYEPRVEKSTGAWILLLVAIVLLCAGGYFGYMYYWQPQKLREQLAARESARAAEAQREREQALALARSKAVEEARAKAAQEAERAEQAARAASAADAGVTAPAVPDAGTALARKPPPPKTAPRVARSEPHNFDYYMTQGYRLLENQSPTLALEAFGQAADLRPDRAEPFGGRGLALLRVGDLSQAEASFQEALKLNPKFGIAVIGLAKTYLAQGRRDKAADYYGKYLEILPDGPEANGAKLALKQLRPE